MKILGFTLDAEDGFDKSLAWSQQGKIGRVVIQAEHWPKAEANKALFPKYKNALNPLGVAVGAQLWGSEMDTMPARIANIRNQVHPNFWSLNIESPPKENEGYNLSLIMQATKPEPLFVTYNNLADRIGLDFRRIALRSGEIHGQCYDVDGDYTKGPGLPSDHVTQAMFPLSAYDGGGGAAWWYRVKVGKTWFWMQKSGDQMRSPTNMVVYPDLNGSTFAATRAVRKSPGGAVVGKVFGVAAYHRIGYSLATTRPISPAKIVELASAAKAPGQALCKRASLYTIENATQDQVDALWSVVQ